MERDGVETRQKEAWEFQNAARGRPETLAEEVWSFLTESRKWWLFPLAVALVMAGTLVMWSDAVAPFLYTLF